MNAFEETERIPNMQFLPTVLKQIDREERNSGGFILSGLRKYHSVFPKVYVS